MKILLISPSIRKANIFGLHRRLSLGYNTFAPLTLLVLASLTADDIEIIIIDEEIDDIPYDNDVDLVAISIPATFLANHAYRIANEFRKRSIKVIFGGYHSSMLPNESSIYADSVCIGEAEYCWRNIIEDYKNRRLKRYYIADRHTCGCDIPGPNYSIIDPKRYIICGMVQTSRGCPYHCDYCAVSSFMGNHHRTRPITNVIYDIEHVPLIHNPIINMIINRKLIFFVDDNIFASREHALKLFSALSKHNICWIGSTSVNLLKDDELLYYAKASGCLLLSVGLESISDDSLHSIGKHHNIPSQFTNLILNAQSKGIAISANFMFGFDYDNPNTFANTIDYINNNNIDMLSFSILTPLPGTDIYYKFKKEHRILSDNWDIYDEKHVVFRPMRLNTNQLYDGFKHLCETMLSRRKMLSMYARTYLRGNRRIAFAILISNLLYSSNMLKQLKALK